MPGGYREETLTLHSTVHTRDWYYLTDQSDEFQTYYCVTFKLYCDTFKLVAVVGGFFPPASSVALAARSALASRAIFTPSSMKAATCLISSSFMAREVRAGVPGRRDQLPQ